MAYFNIENLPEDREVGTGTFNCKLHKHIELTETEALEIIAVVPF